MRASSARDKPDFKAYLLGGPKVDDFPVERDRDHGRRTDPIAAPLDQG